MNDNERVDTLNSAAPAAVVLHAFSNREISLVMRAIRKAIPGKDIIFAKSTPTSLKMKLGDLIDDISEDHRYLKDNPPNQSKS